MDIQLEVFNEKLLDLIDPHQELETVISGFQFAEGPIWNHKEQHLTFSDIPASKIYRWSAQNGLSVLVEESHKSNGNCYDFQGRILTCEHGTSLVSRRNVDGTNREVLVSHFEGKELNSPNDIVVKRDGSFYFTDPRFGRNASRVGIPREQQLSFQGVFRFEPDSRRLTLLADDFEAPNGISFSDDEKLLFVNDSPLRHIRAFDVKEDGTLGSSRVWAETIGDGPGLPDGMKVDVNGNLYCTAQGGLHFFDRLGTYLGILHIPEQTGNFTWGDHDLQSLYFMSSTTIYRVKVKYPSLLRNKF